jgi:hypothetical protein
MRADGHALTAEAEWLSCLDVDEFINVKVGDGTIDALLSHLDGADMIPMCWRRFGAAGIQWFEDRPVTEQFTRAAPEICPYPFHNYGFKSLWRREAGWARFGVHRPLDLDPARAETVKVVNGDRNEMPRYRDKGLWLAPQIAGYGGVQVNHYSLRSAASFLVKCARGLPNSQITNLDLGYWAERNFNQEEETSVHRVAPQVAKVLADLKADPVLRSLHDAACTWHSRKIDELLAHQETLQLFLRLIITESASLPFRDAIRLNKLITRSWEMERVAHKKDG